VAPLPPGTSPSLNGSSSLLSVPVSFIGRSLGVLHSIGPVQETIEDQTSDNLVYIATGAGSRIGMLRSMAKTEVQATTDALTTMFNRRAFESPGPVRASAPAATRSATAWRT